MGDPPVLLRGLAHRYGRGALARAVLQGIDLEVRPGEIVLVTGPSGSGKTTLLTLIGALRAPQEGSVRILGTELLGAPERRRREVRRRIGYVFQAHNLLASLSAERNVAMALRGEPGLRRRGALSRAGEALEAVGLADHRGAFPDRLSGGQRQRVAIARALVRRPRLVLADEPTASLDKVSGRAVVDLMRDLARQEGCAVLLVTHDNRILDVADRIVHIEDGRLHAFGEEVASSTRRMLEAFSGAGRRGELARQLREMPFAGFARFVEQLTAEFQSLLLALDLSEHDALETMLDQVLEALTAKVGALVHADRATLFVVDRGRGELWAKVVKDGTEIRIPLGRGIAGHVAATGETRNVADAYDDPLFNPDVDRRSGYRTRSLLTLPLLDSHGASVAVVQVLNKEGGGPFDASDERTLREAAGAMAVTLEIWTRMRERAATSLGPSTR